MVFWLFDQIFYAPVFEHKKKVINFTLVSYTIYVQVKIRTNKTLFITYIYYSLTSIPIDPKTDIFKFVTINGTYKSPELYSFLRNT